MTPQDIQRIETALGLRVPEAYATVVLNYPCPDSDDICLHGLFNDQEHVIKVNQEHRKDGWSGLDWPDRFLAIGDTGCGDTYFMVIGEDDKVYIADHEGGPSYETELGDCAHSPPRRLNRCLLGIGIELHGGPHHKLATGVWMRLESRS